VLATDAAVATTVTAAAQPQPPPPAQAPAGPVPVGTVVHALPPGCAPTPIKGVEYYNCGPGVFYRSAFQGNNLVYVAAQP
jgi:hypothetical protein